MTTTKTGFSGLYPMTLAFFDADDRVDLEAMRKEVEAVAAHRPHGIGVLGLATEVNKLSLAERHQVLECVAEVLDGTLPLSVTVAENSVDGQMEFARAAIDAGASWLILQPPPVKDVSELVLQRFFGRVADRIDVPVGIQNAPMYLGIGLSSEGLLSLNRQHPNIAILKTEDPPMEIARTVEETDGAYDVFAGRGGLEMPELMRAGCVGCIPGVEVCDRLARVSRLLHEGDLRAAEAVYREAEPVIVFLEQSINHFVTYSRELTARRLGLGRVEHRLGKDVTPYTESLLDRFSDELGPL